eukprot:GEMP01072094.1.p1 GENE.GEMP01072094.1~~GEMP01072094.1.p1  ORF type:complete len:319 (+),score=52.32 GEMP01072094.1:239-1195(+)
MEGRNSFMNQIESKRPAEAILEEHHGETVFNATVIAAADNHKWYGKGNENYDAMHDAEANDVLMILFFKLKLQVNFVGMAKIVKGMKGNEKEDIVIEKGKSTWKLKVNCAKQRKLINKAAVTANMYGMPKLKEEGDWKEVEAQYPWGEEEERQVRKWCEESWSYLRKKQIPVDQSDEDTLKEKFGEEWVRRVKETVQANRATSTYAASNTSSLPEDQYITAGSGSRAASGNRSNSHLTPGYSQGYQHATLIATTYNQGQGAQPYRRQQYRAGPITQEVIDERYEDSAQWMERILNMNRDEKKVLWIFGPRVKKGLEFI